MSQRTTMADIARLAGVSSSAVSFALNGRAGVSPETRERVVSIARELGWYPNAAARALSGVGSGAVGLIFTRPPRALGVEPFHMSFLAGLEACLSERGYSLLTHISPDAHDEMQTYRRWATERRIDGLVLIDLRVNDARPELVRQLDLPTVVVGDPKYAGGLTSVWTADAAAITSAVQRLVELGHIYLARVSEQAVMAHVAIRTQAFLQACQKVGVPTPYLREADATAEGGRQVTRELLVLKKKPTAIIFDNTIMAAASLAAARACRVRVPQDLSIIAYDDSLLCEITQPPLSALSHDVYGYGAHTADVLLRQIHSDSMLEHELDAEPHLVERGSTAAPRRTKPALSVLTDT